MSGPSPGQTVLVAEAPELEPFVRSIRLEHDSSARRGLPAHVTIQHPFVAESQLSSHDDVLAELLTRFEPFDANFATVETFRRVVWLAPVPATNFVQLAVAVRERWPDIVEQVDRDREYTPHLTLAKGLEPSAVPPMAERLSLELEDELPARIRVRTLSVFGRDQDLNWVRRRVYELGEPDQQH